MKKLLLLPLAITRLLLQNILLALGQIWANKTRSMLTTIGIVIGVASVTAVIAALTGMKQNVLSEFEKFGTNKIYVFPHRPSTGPHKNASWRFIQLQPEQFEDLRLHCPSVEGLTLYQQTYFNVQYRDELIESVAIQSINPDWHKIENRHVTFGRPFSLIDVEQAKPVCIINTEVRDKLNLNRNCIGQYIIINNRSFQIVGMVDKHVGSKMLGGQTASLEVFIPFSTGWKLSRNWLYAIASSKSTEVTDDARAEIKFFLRKTRNLRPGDPDTFRIEVIEEYIKQFNQMAIAISVIAGGIVCISLLVAGVGIMNIMLVSVSERTREIGLRKAVGATPLTIMLQFLIEAVTLCFIGGILGLVGGQLITLILTQFPDAKLDKAYIPFYAVLLAFGFSATVGIVFGMFPAIKAATLDPIEALRHE